MHYYQFNIADYRKDTQHLTPIEHYIYRELMDWMYLDEAPIPNDMNLVIRRLRLTQQDSTTVQQVFNDFFTETDEGYTQDRVMFEIGEYQRKIESASKAGKASAKARKLKASTPKSNDRSTTVQPTINHKPVTINHKPIKDKTLVGKKPDESDFEIHWEAYGKKGNRKTSLAKFGKLTLDQIALLKIHLPKYVASTPEKKFRKNFESYLFQECWNDEVVTSKPDKHSGFKDRDYSTDATKTEELSWMQ